MLHHLHTRKRLQRKLESYPASTAGLRVLDRVIYAVGIIGPLMTIPQLMKIYYLHNAAGVSAVSWGAYAILDIPWILYGVLHREPPITFTYILWFIFNILVFVGTLLYSNQPL